MDAGWNPASLPYARELLDRLTELRAQVTAAQERLLEGWRAHLEFRGFLGSAANLAAYIALRRHDLRELQRRLTSLGLASLGESEGHVLATLDAVTHALRLIQGNPVRAADVARIGRSMERDQLLRYRNTNRLLGMPPETRWMRFMVTLPGQAAADYDFVRELMGRGMDCARVNCSRDDKGVWRDIIGNVRQAEKELGRSCKVLMDLAGPKLCTGPLDTGPAMLHVKVKRDQFGDPLRPTLVVLDGSGRGGRPASVDRLGHPVPARLAVDRKWLAKLEPGDKIAFRDLKRRKRELTVESRCSETEVLTSCIDGAYIPRGTELEHHPHGAGKKGGKTPSGPFAAPPAEIEVSPGGALLLTRDRVPGEPEQRDKRGRVVSPAHIGCTDAAVFDFIEPGQAVWIDGGRVGALVEKVDRHGAWLRITRARPEGERIGADRSINFPDSRIELPALAERDLAHLDTACKYADMVSFSCFKGAEDVDQLVEALGARGGRHVGIIAKIETPSAVEHLPDIIVHGAGRHPFGIMIGRGDLAAVFGYGRLAEVQRTILSLCEAAHVPVIWATQVLESLAKRDLPSRAELIDTAMAQRGECVMLSTGPNVFHALALLETAVAAMPEYQFRKSSGLRALKW
jgi:pyruvate kinase